MLRSDDLARSSTIPGSEAGAIRHPRAAFALAAGALAVGVGAWWHYASAGLTLSHYDARAHLVVARRIFDGLMPGWQQIGAVWLPLPHLLNALPVQVDAWYRTGASGTALSVLGLSAGVWAVAALIVRVTGSVSAAAAAAALLLANPNTLYLQSTPMTEPLLLGATLLSIALTAAWLDTGAATPPRAAGFAIAAACMTRYEAWPISAALIALAGAVLLRRGAPLTVMVRACARLVAYPAIAILIFSVNSWWTTGTWFVSHDFFVPENEALGRPLAAWRQVQDGLSGMAGTATIWPAWAGAALLVWVFARCPSRAVLILVLALAAAAALPWYAYVQGHPFRIRYSLPLVAACAVITGVGISLLHRRVRAVAAATVVVAAVLQLSPLDRTARLVLEAQWDAPNQAARRVVSTYLGEHYDRGPIMMSMGSLAHFMHDLSHAGFRIRDFLHEGNGDLWLYAYTQGPRGHVRWIAIEERAEGGDTLYQRAEHDAEFLDGFDRVAEGGGVALYRARRGQNDTPGGSGSDQ